MASIKHLVANKTKLHYDELSSVLIEQFARKSKLGKFVASGTAAINPTAKLMISFSVLLPER